jgi:hypothetical protein
MRKIVGISMTILVLTFALSVSSMNIFAVCNNTKKETTKAKNTNVFNIDNDIFNKEINKLPKNLILDLYNNYDLKIELVEDLGTTVAYGNVINQDGNIKYSTMTIKVEKSGIEHALNHEIGHALVRVWALHEDEDIIKSFEDKELYFGDYYNQDINEYIAEGIKHYYNNELPDSDLKEALERVLSIYDQKQF